MKNLKYVLIFIALVIAGTPNLAAMTKEALTETKKAHEVKAPADIGLSAPQFDLETVNKRLATIIINGGFFIIQEDHEAYFKEWADENSKEIFRQFKLFFVKDKKTTYTECYVQYQINPGISTYIAWVGIEEEYKKMGWGTLLVLIALHDAVILNKNCNYAYAYDVSRNEISGNLFRNKFDFKSPHKLFLCTKKLSTVLQEKTLVLLKEIFGKLEKQVLMEVI